MDRKFLNRLQGLNMNEDYYEDLVEEIVVDKKTRGKKRDAQLELEANAQNLTSGQLRFEEAHGLQTAKDVAAIREVLVKTQDDNPVEMEKVIKKAFKKRFALQPFRKCDYHVAGLPEEMTEKELRAVLLRGGISKINYVCIKKVGPKKSRTCTARVSVALKDKVLMETSGFFADRVVVTPWVWAEK